MQDAAQSSEQYSVGRPMHHFMISGRMLIFVIRQGSSPAPVTQLWSMSAQANRRFKYISRIVLGCEKILAHDNTELVEKTIVGLLAV